MKLFLLSLFFISISTQVFSMGSSVQEHRGMLIENDNKLLFESANIRTGSKCLYNDGQCVLLVPLYSDRLSISEEISLKIFNGLKKLNGTLNDVFIIQTVETGTTLSGHRAPFREADYLDCKATNDEVDRVRKTQLVYIGQETEHSASVKCACQKLYGTDCSFL